MFLTPFNKSYKTFPNLVILAQISHAVRHWWHLNGVHFSSPWTLNILNKHNKWMSATHHCISDHLQMFQCRVEARAQGQQCACAEPVGGMTVGAWRTYVHVQTWRWNTKSWHVWVLWFKFLFLKKKQYI